MTKYPLGCIPAEYDPRDYATQLAAAVVLPEADEIPDSIPNYNQTGGTCVAQSIRPGWQRKYGIQFGVDMLYGLARMATYQNIPGLDVRTAADFACTNGIAPLAVDPGEMEVPAAYLWAISNRDKLLAAAAPYKGWTYAMLDSPEKIKAAIHDRRHVVVRITFEKFDTDRCGWLAGSDGGYSHAVVIRGYGKWPTVSGAVQEGVLIRNSWGEGWGVKGDCYMTWQDVLRCREVYVFFPPAGAEDKTPIITARPSLRLGAKGEYVKQAQGLLNKHGASLTVDGDFGAKTNAAVIAFQRVNGLIADGIVGVKTWAALDAAPIVTPTGKVADFIAYLKSRVGDLYVWGAQGQSDITEAWIRRMSQSTTTGNAAVKLWQSRVKFGKDDLRAFDCSGLVMYYLKDLKGYLKTDTTADGLYRMSTKITRAQLQPGDLVFRRNAIKAYHVGVYIGEGQVVEAQGSAYGVVLRSIDASGTGYWTHFGRLSVLEG